MSRDRGVLSRSAAGVNVHGLLEQLQLRAPGCLRGCPDLRVAACCRLQLMNARDPHTTEARYIDVIRRKTARLFEAGAQIAAVLSDASPEIEESLARYGRHIGTAFQLVDDALDYQADEASLGKHLGDDLAEGKPTLPLIYAMQHGSDAQRDSIRQAIEKGGLDQLAEITRAVASLGGLAYTARLAQCEADQALAALAPLPETAFKEGLSELARFAVARKN